MSNINYIGEHLLPGQIGHFLVVLAFISAGLSALALFQSHRSNDVTWKSLGRMAFTLHGTSILSIIGIIFYLMINKHYEYHYVWSHVSDDLPFRYIFSAFWEGQEGSFLLWMFWHVVLGFFIMWKNDKWTDGVLATVGLIQFFLVSMILGVYVMGHKFGSSPFILLRDAMDIPLFANAQYLELIEGTGLNPLLQNYWNTIHPPTTFLGFASLTIPYAYAISGLISKDKSQWVNDVLPWGLFSGAVLGTGILMGAAWAYEALSFGGYWSWDPVENSSLVPWLIMIAGIHTNLIAKSTGRSVVTTYAFYLLAFVLIVYSTFLTRSGILGDTSVHAFTEMGLEWQLIIFLASFSILGIILLIKNYGTISFKGEEEPIESREFWMFIGALVLLFSAVLISFTTSIPVYNKIFDAVGSVIGSDMSSLHRTSPLEPIEHYNRYQLWIAVLIGLLSAFAIYLRYTGKGWKNYRRSFYTKMGLHVGIAAILTLVLSWWINLYNWTYWLLLFSAMLTITANMDYLISFSLKHLKKAGSTVSHIGFGLLILGIMASGLNKSYLSSNPFAQRGLIDNFDEERLNRNITLIEGAPMFMNDFWVTYVKDTMVGNLRKYLIHYRQVDSSGKKLDEFVLSPQVVYDNKVTKVASVNPSTKRYLHKDIFTHITSIPPQLMDVQMAAEIEDSLSYQQFALYKGDTFYIGENVRATIKDIIRNPTHVEYTAEENDIAFGVRFLFEDTIKNMTWQAKPMAVLRGNLIYKYSDQVNPIKVRIELLDDIFNSDRYSENLEFQSIKTGLKQPITVDDHQVTIQGFSEEINHPGYDKVEGDIAITAFVEVITPSSDTLTLKPVYVIRDSRQFSLNAFDAHHGIHLRLSGIDPSNGVMSLEIAFGNGVDKNDIPFRVADNVPRSDYIVMEAIVFPGINLVWIGSILMIIGLFMGVFDRRKKAR